MLVDIEKFYDKLEYLADGDNASMQTIRDLINQRVYEVKLSERKIDEIALKDIEVQINKLREDLQIEKDNNNASYLYGIFFGLSYAYNNLIKQ
jgi:hypothetical protein